MPQGADRSCTTIATDATESHAPGAGVNNAFLIATRNPLARRYNDNSVLENSHISAMYNLMEEQPDMDVFGALSPEHWRDARKLVIHAILHTDMTYHFPLVSQVRAAPPD